MKRYAIPWKGSPVLEVILGSRTRAGVLRVLLSDGPRRYRLLELVRAVGTSVSSLQGELERLERIGLVRSEREGDARYVSVVGSHPYVPALRVLLEVDRGFAMGADSSRLAGSERDDASLDLLNPAIRPRVAAITDACRRHGVRRAALVGSATQADPTVVPADLDVLVRFDPRPEGRAERYFALLAELEAIMGMPVDVIEEDGLSNPYLIREFEATQVVLYEAA
jgi:predicted nucleotidyltransferase